MKTTKLDPKKLFIAALCVLLALTSILLISSRAASPAYYSRTIESINDKTQTVLRLTAASSLASAGLSTLPGDAATPIAEKLADFSEYFILILCVLYAEKFMLTILGVGAFRFLIPMGLCALCLDQFWHRESLRRFAVKVILVSLALFLLIPASIGASDFIYDTYKESIDQVIESAEELSDESAQVSESAENQSALGKIKNAVTSAVEGVTEKAANILNRYIESLAIMIVTACIIPLLTLLLFLWAIRQVTGIDLFTAPPMFRRSPRSE